MKLDFKKIQVVMARNMWNATDVSNRYGCSATWFYGILKTIENEHPVRTDVAGKLANALKVDVSEIMAE